jgi:hypothetical protein
MYIKELKGQSVPPLLSKQSIQVNNLKIGIEPNGQCTVETQGEWQGDVMELISVLAEVTNNFLEKSDADQ